MNRVTVWMLTGVIAAAGCTASKSARAQEPATPPAPPEELRERELEQAAKARQDARRAAEESRKAAVEARAQIRERLNENGVRAYARNVKKEKAAYLGVSTSPVPGALREQMKLARGFGLVVDTVEKESAAGEAGIQQYDILQKLNDQLLVNSQQLGVLVRSMKAGENVTLTFLRGGQSQTVNATLKEKEMPVLGDGSWNVELAPLANMAVTPLPQLGEMNWSPTEGHDVFRFFTTGDDEMNSVYQDSEMTLTLTQENDEKSLTAKSAIGETVFEGPISTDEQRSKLPKDVAEKLAKFESRIEKLNVDGKKVRVKVIEP